SLLPPSEEVNADDSANKSSSRTYVPPVRDVPQKKQVAETQPGEETVATADATQSLGASESAEEQGNQPKTADAEKVTVLNIRGTVSNHSQTSLGESGEVKGYLRPNKESESALTFPNFLYTLSLHSGNDSSGYKHLRIDPETSRLC
ncbi:hypothetical protein Tco_0262048, partial [Tanacetum coccineum]